MDRPNFRELRNRRRREGSRTNRIVQSENFDTTWVDQAQGVTTAAATTAPDGTNTGFLLADNEATGTGFCGTAQSHTHTRYFPYTISVWSKANGNDWLYADMLSLTGLQIFAYFDLTNGVIGASQGTDTERTWISKDVNGWYRCSFSYIASSSDLAGVCRFYVADGDGDNEVALDGTSSIYIWGAQVSPDPHPIDYIKTEATAYIG